MSAIHVADTGLFVAMGQPSNRRYLSVKRIALRNEITFVLPGRVYDELTVKGSSVETPPVEKALDEGWAAVAPLPSYDPEKEIPPS